MPLNCHLNHLNSKKKNDVMFDICTVVFFSFSFLSLWKHVYYICYTFFLQQAYIRIAFIWSHLDKVFVFLVNLTAQAVQTNISQYIVIYLFRACTAQLNCMYVPPGPSVFSYKEKVIVLDGSQRQSSLQQRWGNRLLCSAEKKGP